MTWTWRIDGLGTDSQTLVVMDDSGAEVATTTASGFSWSGDFPDFVRDTVAANDVQAALSEDIERAE